MSSRGKKPATYAWLTASMISAALLTSGCENLRSSGPSPDSANLQIVESRGALGRVDLDEASAEDGDPLIVTSNVSVETGRHSSVTGKDGGRVESKNIFGWATMPRVVYFRIIDRLRRAEAAVSRAEERNAIIDILANKCRDDSVCFAAAKPHIAKVVGEDR